MTTTRPQTQRFFRFAWMLTAGMLTPAAFAQETAATPPAVSAATQPSTEAVQHTPDTAPATAQPGEASTIRKELASPRAAITTFLRRVAAKEFEKAAQGLDLSELKPEQRKLQGAALARKLETLRSDRMAKVDLELYSDQPDYVDENDQPRAVLTTVKTEDGETVDEIVLTRGEDGNWRFSRETVAMIPSRFEALTKKLETQPAEPPPAAGENARANFANPRATMRTFLDAMRAKSEPNISRALECMDLSMIPSTVGQVVIDDRPKQLLNIINRTRDPVLQTIPQDPKGPEWEYETYDHGTISIARLEKGDRKGEWVFTASTVGALDEILSEVSQRDVVEGIEETEETQSTQLWIIRYIPTWLRGEILGVDKWKWVGLTLLVMLGLLADLIIRTIARTILNRELIRRGRSLEDSEKRRYVRPIGLVVMGITWSQGLRWLALPEDLLQFLMPAAQFITAFAGVWAVYRVVDLVCDYLTDKAKETASKFDDLLIPMLRKTLKIVVSIMGLAFLTEAFGWPFDKVLAGLGIGGLAIGFAARETLQNFFGSITVLLDRPFHIGDWVIIGDHEGSVETVGFRSTRIRTFYNSLITVPNGQMLTATVDNMGARRYRRIKTMLSLTYDTPPEKIDAFCEGIREVILQHPYTRKDYFHVYFNQYDSASLNVLLYCFIECPDWGTELREKHRLFNHILQLAKQIGVEFAFPTQTLHIHQENDSSLNRRKPSPDKPERAGRHAATQIVKESGIAGLIPPPVTFDQRSRGSVDDGNGDGDGG